MTPLGLDLSLTSTGICYEHNDAVVNVAITSKVKGMDRLIRLRDVVLDNLSNLTNPVVIVEGYSFGSRNSQAHATGELGGVVRVALWEEGVPFIEIPPTCLKKFATGRGNANKNEVISSISARTGIVWTGAGADDMCDAFVLWQMGLTKLGMSQYDWTSVQLEGLAKVDWTNLGEAGKMVP